MGTTRPLTGAVARVEQRRRQESLLRLRWELARIGMRVYLRKPRNGRWKLTVRVPGWTETVLCAGAEDTYAYVTTHGRLLGPVSDVRRIAQVLSWMVERRRR
ncbi:hypothetical protein [Actinomadura hibisca]|uniref:hypothetical protein n=1 Tax=Actinomadura hibisca TaxID=68565 RepID=UPI000ADE6F71|nr:hypothetical protein [Actinomadura hibisca]